MLQQSYIEHLGEIVGEECISSSVDIISYSRDVSEIKGQADVIVQPKTTEQVSQIVKLAYENRIPVTPRGNGSGVTGGAVPLKGGIVIDLTRMNTILEYSPEDFYIIVEAGIIHAALQKELNKSNFFFPPDPGSSEMATIGGLVANNGGGMRSIKYGVMKDYVLGLKIVLPNGDIIKVGGKVLKSSSGYDLTKLFVGSEGTLGVITECTLRIHPLPPSKAVVIASFNTLKHAAEAVISTYYIGITPDAIELLDDSAISAVKKYNCQIEIPDSKAMLLFELMGVDQVVNIEMEKISDICQKNNAIYIRKSTNLKECDELWEARRIVGAATSALTKDYYRVYDGEDICVPRSKMVKAFVEIRKISIETGIPIVLFGHISDGNIHPALIIDKRSDEDWKKLRKAVDEIHRVALKLGGTVSAEHGIGVVKAKYMKEMHGQALDVMRAIKKIIDPKNIMNPGKMDLEV